MLAISSASRIEVQVLDWFQKPQLDGPIDIVIASDVVWLAELIDPLVTTIKRLIERQSSPLVVYMSYQSRSIAADNKLFQALELVQCKVETIPTYQHHPEYSSSKVNIYRITKI